MPFIRFASFSYSIWAISPSNRFHPCSFFILACAVFQRRWILSSEIPPDANWWRSRRCYSGSMYLLGRPQYIGIACMKRSWTFCSGHRTTWRVCHPLLGKYLFQIQHYRIWDISIFRVACFLSPFPVLFLCLALDLNSQYDSTDPSKRHKET